VVLPPYYFRQASESGLFDWFLQVIHQAVPEDRYLLGYHIPAMSGVPFTIPLLKRLKSAFPHRFAGIKDSSGDPQLAVSLGNQFGSALTVLTGNDGLLLHALRNDGSGCITALANLFSPDLRQLWDNQERGIEDPALESRVQSNREILNQYTPFPPTIKALIHSMYGLPRWPVRPPLQALPDPQHQEIRRNLGLK
jgi:4-hydroxy-tetrahydrodipicolinate synthase